MTMDFSERATRALRELFDRAKTANPVQFAISLIPEFRGSQGPGWCAWEETQRAFKEFSEFLNVEHSDALRIRVALGFYCHLAEASGFYEIPKNLMRIVGGEDYLLWPFVGLNRTQKSTGRKIGPNANKVFRELIDHALEVDLRDLADVLNEAFDPRIRNAYAHADYILWQDGFRIRNRACGFPEIIPWPEFKDLLNRGFVFYQTLCDLRIDAIAVYETPQLVVGSTSSRDRPSTWRIASVGGEISLTSVGP